MFSSRQSSRAVRRDTFVGTALYVSPEMLNENQALPESDFWALGIIIYRITFGKAPFEGTHENLTFQKILNRELTFPEDADESVKDLIDNLLRIDPNERIKFEEIKEHPFFEGVNFETLT